MGGIHRTSTGHWGSSGIGSWTPPLLHMHYITGSHHTGTWFLIPLLCWWHTALSLISTRWYNGSCMHLRLPGGHLCMDERTSPTTWQRLSLSFLIQHAAHLLVQALVISRLDYCNALLAGLPSCIIKPLQMIQNAAVRLVFCEPKRAHVTPLFISLHWLPVAARIKSKTLMLAYRTATGSAPAYFHSLMTIYIPSRSLRSASKRRLVVPSQRGTKSLSRTFSFTVPGWWNELTTLIQSAESLTIFKRHLKTNLFRHHLISRLAKICSEQCLEICITSTSFVCLPLYNVLLILFLNCKSLWIKASSKLINVNVM